MTEDKSCESRVQNALAETLDDLRLLWSAYCNAGDDCPLCGGDDSNRPICDGEGTVDDEGNTAELGNLYEYGLWFDYVAPLTFTDQEEGYFRYQLSTGGPGDEFRIYAGKVRDWQWSVYRIEYWFLDWFDGASRRLFGEGRELVEEIFQSIFVETGTVDVRYQEALED